MNNGLNIIIVDDEQPARNKLRLFLQQQPDIKAIYDASNGEEAVQLIVEHNLDLIFLDIQMPGMNGFEVIDTIGADQMPVVIFVTAYDQYAIDAFEVQAMDYLLKPYDEERFNKAYSRALAKIAQQHNQREDITEILVKMRHQHQYLKRVMIKDDFRIFFIPVADIIYISAYEKYIRIHTQDDVYMIRETMSSFEQQLDPEHFSRIHRSYIVNIDCIKELQSWSRGDYIVILQNDIKLNMSRRYKHNLLKNNSL